MLALVTVTILMGNNDALINMGSHSLSQTHMDNRSLSPIHMDNHSLSLIHMDNRNQHVQTHTPNSNRTPMDKRNSLQVILMGSNSQDQIHMLNHSQHVQAPIHMDSNGLLVIHTDSNAPQVILMDSNTHDLIHMLSHNNHVQIHMDNGNQMDLKYHIPPQLNYLEDVLSMLE